MKKHFSTSRTFLLAAMLIFVLALTACTGDDEPGTPLATTATETTAPPVAAATTVPETTAPETEPEPENDYEEEYEEETQATSDLYGRFIAEDYGIILTFAGNTFTMDIPLAEIVEMDIDEHFAIGGTFVVNPAAQRIFLSITEEDIVAFVVDLLDVLVDVFIEEMLIYELGEDFAEMVEDEAFMQGFLMMMGAMIDGMFEEMFDEMVEDMLLEMSDWVLRFEDDFSRLYDDEDDIVFVREN